MQVESVVRFPLPDAVGKVPDRLVRLERKDVVQRGMVGNERCHVPLRGKRQRRLGVAPIQGTKQRRGEQDVADRAEPDDEDSQHESQCRAALLRPASRTRFRAHAASQEHSVGG